jgi:hypothetical protein
MGQRSGCCASVHDFAHQLILEIIEDYASQTPIATAIKSQAQVNGFQSPWRHSGIYPAWLSALGILHRSRIHSGDIGVSGLYTVKAVNEPVSRWFGLSLTCI